MTITIPKTEWLIKLVSMIRAVGRIHCIWWCSRVCRVVYGARLTITGRICLSYSSTVFRSPYSSTLIAEWCSTKTLVVIQFNQHTNHTLITNHHKTRKKSTKIDPSETEKNCLLRCLLRSGVYYELDWVTFVLLDALFMKRPDQPLDSQNSNDFSCWLISLTELNGL